MSETTPLPPVDQGDEVLPDTTVLNWRSTDDSKLCSSTLTALCSHPRGHAGDHAAIKDDGTVLRRWSTVSAPETSGVTARQIVVVDIETNGLDHRRHIAVEIAWHNLSTDEFGVFVPPHSWRDAVTEGELEALRVNGYLDRLASAPQDRIGDAGRRLWKQLDGNTFAGCNPAFDAEFVRDLWLDQVYDLDRGGFEEPPTWHHRLLDLSAYTAGVLGVPAAELPGLGDVCELLGVTHEHPHTAFGDVAATVECFRKLFDRQGLSATGAHR